MVIKVFTGTKGRTRFSAPIPDAIFFVISFICVVHERFSSTYTPRDLAWETCLIGVPGYRSLLSLHAGPVPDCDNRENFIFLHQIETHQQ